MKEIKIRKATTKDAERILDINISSWKKTYKNIFPNDFLDKLCTTKKEYNESLNNIIKNIEEKNNYLVAIEDDNIVGFINYGPSRNNKYLNSGEVYAFYIDNEYTQNGIGSLLFKSAIEKMKKEYEHIIVSCIKDNSSNSFYIKMGCKKIGETNFVLNDKKYIENLYEVN